MPIEIQRGNQFRSLVHSGYCFDENANFLPLRMSCVALGADLISTL